MKDTLHFEIIRPLESEAKWLFQFRNDPETLNMSFHPEKQDFLSFLDIFL